MADAPGPPLAENCPHYQRQLVLLQAQTQGGRPPRVPRTSRPLRIDGDNTIQEQALRLLLRAANRRDHDGAQEARRALIHARGQKVLKCLPRAAHCTDRAQTSTTATPRFELCPPPLAFRIKFRARRDTSENRGENDNCNYAYFVSHGVSGCNAPC